MLQIKTLFFVQITLLMFSGNNKFELNNIIFNFWSFNFEYISLQEFYFKKNTFCFYTILIDIFVHLEYNSNCIATIAF